MSIADIPASYLFLYVFFIVLGVCIGADVRFELDWSWRKMLAVAAAAGAGIMLLRLLGLI
ncbi:hypothetical protein [Conchiformibius kuhniae]|uniref:Uncharacterized protein n=1 Tax=Conchiformibius kuhniae TaxID=211502 RepID=A0A8T9MSW0_9NEIS|nr:hypothetical protein [Conchiformibius kuhniae]UOP04361.1 hypothetical protein LVJ77_08435 [Conchiformibius kuhniae]